MKQEIESIERNKTWHLTKLPAGHKAIGLKWVYKVKRDANGDINKYKARLVAKGYVQKQGLDFDEVFAPVARMETVRLILALAANEGWKVHHLDVKSAFLHGNLKEEVYVQQPQGFEKKGSENMVYRLDKALYGLRQAPRAWNHKLDQTLKELGFDRCSYEQAVYKQTDQDGISIVGVYVDDLIVTGSSSQKTRNFVKQMESKFEMINLGLLSYYLGIEVEQGTSGIVLKQSSYARKLLDMTQMQDCNPCRYPMEPKMKLTREENGPGVDETNRFMASPKEIHRKAVKHILRYVKGTVDHGIKSYKGGGKELLGYSDSSFATDQYDGKGTTGLVFFFGGGPIAWASTKQQTVALSSCEAEFMAATATACQAIWLQNVLKELTGWETKKVKLKVDNKSAIELMKNPVFHGRSKHIDTRYHFIRECIEKELIVVEHVCGEDQVADILTKALPKLKFEEMKGKLGVKDFTNPGQKLGG
ncbi:hypothetical protein E3N88_02062 [Mikania micrantha]|uniref:Reverse transcriptase Ty1/copia-type domain-containing protein n=1 Tax=Mikania micrantha TaxID=192012 RepID=A0A5N6Q4E8_9ASTR|nr:hypothetical protein E3N88_02062 [Mikania micrantha]